MGALGRRGLWRLLPPLPPGSHVVRFGGGDGQRFTVRTTYHLDVDGDGAGAPPPPEQRPG